VNSKRTLLTATTLPAAGLLPRIIFRRSEGIILETLPSGQDLPDQRGGRFAWSSDCSSRGEKVRFRL